MTLKPLIMDVDQLCKSGLPGGSIGPTDQIISIDLPVGTGFKAKNLDRDVRTIQESLNKIKPPQGGPAIPLKIDGKCGPKTNQAIQNFQLKQFGWPGTDGLIEPGKQTLARINQLLFSNTPVDPAEHANIKVKMVSHMGLVSRSIHAAQANLMLALSPPEGWISDVARPTTGSTATSRCNRNPAERANRRSGTSLASLICSPTCC